MPTRSTSSGGPQTMLSIEFNKSAIFLSPLNKKSPVGHFAVLLRSEVTVGRAEEIRFSISVWRNMTLSFCLRDRAEYETALAPSALALCEILQRFVYLYTHCEIDERSVLPFFLCVKMKKSILAIA